MRRGRTWTTRTASSGSRPASRSNTRTRSCGPRRRSRRRTRRRRSTRCSRWRASTAPCPEHTQGQEGRRATRRFAAKILDALGAHRLRQADRRAEARPRPRLSGRCSTASASRPPTSARRGSRSSARRSRPATASSTANCSRSSSTSRTTPVAAKAMKLLARRADAGGATRVRPRAADAQDRLDAGTAQGVLHVVPQGRELQGRDSFAQLPEAHQDRRGRHAHRRREGRAQARSSTPNPATAKLPAEAAAAVREGVQARRPRRRRWRRAEGRARLRPRPQALRRGEVLRLPPLRQRGRQQRPGPDRRRRAVQPARPAGIDRRPEQGSQRPVRGRRDSHQGRARRHRPDREPQQRRGAWSTPTC